MPSTKSRKSIRLPGKIFVLALIFVLGLMFLNPFMFTAITDINFGESQPLAARIARWEQVLSWFDGFCKPDGLADVMFSLANTYADEYRISGKDANRRQIAIWCAERGKLYAERVPLSDARSEQLNTAKSLLDEYADDSKFPSAANAPSGTTSLNNFTEQQPSE